MICYHGSLAHGLKKLTYSENQSRFGGDEKLLYGAAIYLTMSEEEAKGYTMGNGSVYKIQINRPVFDSTDETVLEDYVKKFEQKYHLQNVLLENKNIKDLIIQTTQGKISGLEFPDQLFFIISNDINLYFIIQDIFNDDLEACQNALKEEFTYDYVKINRKNENIWILGLNKDGDGLEILEEIRIFENE